MQDQIWMDTVWVDRENDDSREPALNLFEYDDDGNLVWRSDEYRCYEYRYDEQGRLSSKQYDWGCDATEDPYDSETEYAYDLHGDLVSEEVCRAQARERTTYQYDTLGNLTSRTDENWTNGQGYDAACGEDGEWQVDGHTIYLYDDSGLRIEEQGSDGGGVVYTYDQLGHQIEDLISYPGYGLIRITRVYDSEGNWVEMYREDNTGGAWELFLRSRAPDLYSGSLARLTTARTVSAGSRGTHRDNSGEVIRHSEPS